MSDDDDGHEFIVGTPPGQRPLLTEPVCNCDGDVVQAYMQDVVDLTMERMQDERLCALAVSAALCLCAASFLNPVNYRKAPRDIVQRTCDAATVMETVAKGMRQRVGY